jgi:hypothetical protein
MSTQSHFARLEGEGDSCCYLNMQKARFLTRKSILSTLAIYVARHIPLRHTAAKKPVITHIRGGGGAKLLMTDVLHILLRSKNHKFST